MPKRGREKFGEFKVDCCPLNVAQNVASGLKRPHAAGVGVMPSSADTHGYAVQYGHVRLVLVQSSQPVGQLMFG